MEMFKGYDAGKFYDEMFGSDGTVRNHCAPLLRKFGQLDRSDFLARKANSELYFLRQGITFNVYHDERGTERGDFVGARARVAAVADHGGDQKA